jgi:CRISP-associated protein Cas1
MPLEDVAYIVVDARDTTFTSSLASACMAAGTVIVFSDERHMPSGLALPFHAHHRQAEIAQLQINLTQPLKKRIWQVMVQRKIENQAACLQLVGRPNPAVAAMAKLVGSGDPENIEARAARAYWSSLFDDFTRANESDLRNKMLNYGYAILRSGVARALVASGLLPCFGIFHASVTNPFNLADDLLEPFRPNVDRMVFDLSENGVRKQGDLTPSEKRQLATLLTTDIRMADQNMSLLSACETAAASLVRTMEKNSAGFLQLPVS